MTAAALRGLFRHPATLASAALLALLVLLALLAPVLAPVDPNRIEPASRNERPGTVETLAGPAGAPVTVTRWMGTDSLGRDVCARVLYGARVSLAIGPAVALLATAAGLGLGLLAGWLPGLDPWLMRLMDGVMAVPGILLALALVASWGAGLGTVILAITVPEIPRVARLVRSLVLRLRHEPYVEAAIVLGTPLPRLLWRHVLPGTAPALIVQGTYGCGAAILVESLLSFLGLGVPTTTPSWGNIMADGRALFRVYPHIVLFPGLCLAATVLAVNLLGEGLRDWLDVRDDRRP